MICKILKICVYLIIWIYVWNILPFSLTKYIPGKIIICNYSEYDISELKSESFYLDYIDQWECEEVKKEKIIFIPFYLEMYSREWENLYKFYSFPYDNHGRFPIIFSTKKVIITKLYIEEKMRLIDSRGQIQFTIE